jgi:hypothetical protein
MSKSVHVSRTEIGSMAGGGDEPGARCSQVHHYLRLLPPLQSCPPVNLCRPLPLTRHRSTISPVLPSLSNMLLCDINPTAPLACMSSHSSTIHQYGMLSSLSIRVSDDDFSPLNAKVTWRQGYYTDSILKFRLTFPHNYPEQPPTVHFVTDVFHPLISHQDGTFNLALKFHPWR